MYIQHEIRLDPRMIKRVLRLHPKCTGNPMGKKKYCDLGDPLGNGWYWEPSGKRTSFSQKETYKFF
jgi:hypothetical protein